MDFLFNFESIGLGNRLFTRYIMDSAKLMAGISRKDILPHDIEAKQYEYMSMFYQILSKLTKSTTHPAVLNIIKPSIRYLHENYMKHGLSLAELAAQSNISVAYFRQLFYEVYKISPMKYVTELRIEKAKRMLVDGSLTGSPNVSETALACGWSSVYRFSDYFKSVTGLSPKGYIKSITEK